MSLTGSLIHTYRLLSSSSLEVIMIFFCGMRLRLEQEHHYHAEEHEQGQEGGLSIASEENKVVDLNYFP